MIFLQALTGLAGSDAGVTKVLADWNNMGVFAYVLPFILIFAVVYAILDNVSVFKDRKGINLVIAVAVGLLALQFNFVAVFFGQIFPRAGMGLSVVLISLILAGAFVKWEDNDKKEMSPHKWIFFGVGALAFLFVIANAFSAYSNTTTSWWSDYGSAIIIAVILIGLIVAVMISDKKAH